jgi:hypothetical protein
MEMVLKIANALKDGEISFEEFAELLHDLKNLDLKKLKKLLNYLSIAALFVPQLKPYAVCIQSLRNILNGDSIKMSDVVKAIPVKYQKQIQTILAFTPGISNNNGSYFLVINELMALFEENTKKMAEDVVVSKDFSQELRDMNVTMMKRGCLDPRT